MARNSGYSLTRSDAEIVMGMVARGDRDHDIAAWFGVNQGRIAEVKSGDGWEAISAATADRLPPRGAPGMKGRRLRNAVEAVRTALAKGEQIDIAAVLAAAAQKYDANEA